MENNDLNALPNWAKNTQKLLSWCAERSSQAPSGLIDGDACCKEFSKRKIDSLYYLATNSKCPQQKLYDKIWYHKRQCIEKICEAFSAADIDWINFKGAEFLERYYKPHCIGLVQDFDILVRREQIVETQRVLYGIGYKPARYDEDKECLVDRDIKEIADIELNHYELPAFATTVDVDANSEELKLLRENNLYTVFEKDGKFRIVMEVDIHFQVATDIPNEGFFERAIPSSFGYGKTMSFADHYWFTVSRLYTEVGFHGKLSFRDFAYIIPMLYEEDINWDTVLENATEYDLHASIFYFSEFLNQLVPNKIPKEVLKQLDPSNGPRNRDLGWQLGKLYGCVEPFPYPTG